MICYQEVTLGRVNHHMGPRCSFWIKKIHMLRTCIDYRALNKMTIKNNYLLPQIYELFDLEVVLRKLRNNKLYADREKSDFAQNEIEFLGHVVTKDGIKSDIKKVKAIQEWKRPSTKKGLRSFLGLANYYRRFI